MDMLPYVAKGTLQMGLRVLRWTNKHQIKEPVKKLYDIDMGEVNTLIRPNEEKKA